MKIQKSDPHSTAQAGVAMFIVLLAFGIFLLFYNYQDYLMESGQFTLFMTLAAIGMGLLIGLLYLVYNPRPQKAKVARKAAPAKPTKAKAAKKKKK